MKRLAGVSLAVLVVGFSAAAFQNNPSFRANARLVQINVIVSDKHGPVADLTKDNFSIVDNGRAQEVKVFALNAAGRPGGDKSKPVSPSGIYGGVNRAAIPGGVTVILLDRLNTLQTGAEAYEETPTWMEDHALANAKQHLVKFVEHMDASDVVAIYSLGHAVQVLSEFTNDREKLLAALKNYKAYSLTAREEAEPLAVHTPVPGDFNPEIDRTRRNLAGIVNRNRAEETMAGLLAIAHHVAGIPGRKNLVWLTANLPFSGTAAAMALSRAGVAIYPVDARGLLSAMPPRTDADFDSQARRKSLVAAGQGLEPTGIPEMQKLADETGGRAFVNTNDLTGAIRQAVEDAQVTYTLGFYPAADSLDGKFHKLKVKVVGRGGANVRCGSGYFASKE